MRKTPDERFDAKWVDSLVGCHLWIASRDKDGYGFFADKNLRLVRAHRWAYERVNGPIPDGMVIDHICRVPQCVNPEHLETVTVKVNTLRGQGVAARNSSKTQCKNGHPFSGENLETFKGERICKKCKAAKYKKWYDKHGLKRYHDRKKK